MFRATCACEKFNVTRQSVMNSWINRKCKECKSGIKVYSDNLLAFDYNNASDRRKSRMNNYSIKKLNKVFPGKFNVGKMKRPKIIKTPPPPPSSPLRYDVFMGQHIIDEDYIDMIYSSIRMICEPIEPEPIVFESVQFD